MTDYVDPSSSDKLREIRRLLVHHVPQTSASSAEAAMLVGLADKLQHDSYSAALYGVGLDWYRRRIDELGLGSGLLLDAGCGAGIWTVAAASRGLRVLAADVRA